MRIFSLCVVELFKVFILGLSMWCFYATTLKINVWNDNFSVHFLLMNNIHILWKELVWKNSDLQRTEAIKLSAFCQQCFFNILTKNLLPCFLFIINYLRNSKIIVIDQLIRFLLSNNLTSWSLLEEARIVYDWSHMFSNVIFNVDWLIYFPNFTEVFMSTSPWNK